MPRPVFFNLQSGITPPISKQLVAAVEDQLRLQMTEAHILIASAGGNVDAGMEIFNFMRGIAVPVYTYNYGNVDSIAGVVYCAGRKRFATPHCKFLIHGVTWGWGPSPQGISVTEANLHEYVSQLSVLKGNIASVIAEATNKTSEAVKADMSRSLTMNAAQAKEYGLVHEIKIEMIPQGSLVIPIR